ncbi:MAG: metal-dependent transcriptional regulator [Bacteroidetes bacterium]|nr:metal-dependent transcriptional regulator [Bacteroidota bacterium]MBS1931152.1 metal-dependent transcriptional regulator [Bacteroidota bacterium]
MNFSTSEENYIKAIFHLQQEEDTATTNGLAAVLKARPASITDMLKKLKSKKLVHYQPYRGFRLTSEGKKVALSIIRRHRLWEYFLSEKLKFAWDEVHDVAEDLEHVSSKKLIDKLDEFLGYPRFDPHGDPIPDSQGRIEKHQQVSLSEIPLNKTAIVCHVGDQTSALLELMKHKNIGIGTKLEVKKRFAFDQSIEVKIRQQIPFNISELLAKKIFVKYGV